MSLYYEAFPSLGGAGFLAIPCFIFATASFSHLIAAWSVSCCTEGSSVRKELLAGSRLDGEGTEAREDGFYEFKNAPEPFVDDDSSWLNAVRTHPSITSAILTVISFTLGGVALLYSRSATLGSWEAESICMGCGITAAVIHGCRLFGLLCGSQVGREVVFATPQLPSDIAPRLKSLCQSSHVPSVSIHFECYHYETTHDSKGRSHRRKVTTASGQVPVAVTAAVDRSPLVDSDQLPYQLSLGLRYATLLRVDPQLFHGSPESKQHLTDQEAVVRTTNQHRDTHYSQHTAITLGGMPPRALTIHAPNSPLRPCWLSSPFFILSLLLGLSWFFALLVHMFAADDAFFVVRKYFFVTPAPIPAPETLRGPNESTDVESGEGASAPVPGWAAEEIAGEELVVPPPLDPSKNDAYYHDRDSTGDGTADGGAGVGKKESSSDERGVEMTTSAKATSSTTATEGFSL